MCITKNNFPAPSQRAAHCATADESPVLVVYPAGGNGAGERRRVPSRRRGCLLALDVFFCEVGQLSNKSPPPPITHCPPRFTPGATERDLGADLKKSLLAEASVAALSNIYRKKARPPALRGKGSRSRPIRERLCSRTLELFDSNAFFHARPEFRRLITRAGIGSFHWGGC